VTESTPAPTPTPTPTDTTTPITSESLDLYQYDPKEGEGYSNTVDTIAPVTLIGVSGTSTFGLTSPVAAYQVAGSMQMVQLISLLNADPPTRLNNVCESQFYWTNPSRFVRNGDIGISSRNLNSEDSFPFFNFEQESKPLRNVGIKYGSTFANLFMLMLFLIVAVLFHSFFFALSKNIPEESESK
jgi:hypothetical protein